MIVFFARDPIGNGIVGFYVVTFDFFQNFVGSAGLLVFDIEDRIDEVLTLQYPKAIFEAEAGKDGAVVEGCLTIEVGLRGPPSSGAVLELHPERVKIIALALGSEGREIFHFETARLLKIVIVGDDVGTLLRRRRERERNRREADEKPDRETQIEHRHFLLALVATESQLIYIHGAFVAVKW